MNDRFVHQLRLQLSCDLDDPAILTGWAIQVRVYPSDDWTLVENRALAMLGQRPEELWPMLTEHVRDAIRALPAVLPFE